MRNHALCQHLSGYVIAVNDINLQGITRGRSKEHILRVLCVDLAKVVIKHNDDIV